jgi:hypothetical protein
MPLPLYRWTSSNSVENLHQPGATIVTTFTIADWRTLCDTLRRSIAMSRCSSPSVATAVKQRVS